ncbi:hypothetical protein N7492_007633 [Penicillium capsulatum]|uniref:Aminotransferase class I/classII large domain-containing protein n=1 Tax=Penicillium capsulatum TaxID=69766 RepID=A0A9W9LM87_9EURO|nr:hypothetical protein N7492_007633 [Penicillium capsulatum]
MSSLATFELLKWTTSQAENATLILSGSAPPSLSIKDLVGLSSDQATTSHNLSLDSLSLSLGRIQGSEGLRKAIAALYDDTVTLENVLTTIGATGANALVFQGLLKQGDHVISLYPSYTQLISLPKAITGAEVSLWKPDIDGDVNSSIHSLENLVRPTTKMIVLNNPNNPTGTMLSPQLQHEILKLVHSHDIIIVVDEIFRPLYHDPNTHLPPSFVELSDQSSRVVVTGSLSKAWGLAGVRTGWITTKNTDLFTELEKFKTYTVNSTSLIDEVIATEALSHRCRPHILSKHLGLAQQNLDLLQISSMSILNFVGGSGRARVLLHLCSFQLMVAPSTMWTFVGD